MAKVKRFMVFASAAYYPSGGWGDFIESFDNFEQALVKADEALAKKKNPEIVDCETGEDIYLYPNHRNLP